MLNIIGYMFFRREKPRIPTFDDRLQALAKLDIRSAPKGSGRAAVMRGPCAGVVRQTAENRYEIERLGIVVGNEIGELADGGNQKFWVTPSGKREPAQAEQLVALHAFGEDIRECLDLTSFYNEGLGTVNALHLYDRVKDRDRGLTRA
jgi:hypothetical protein